MANNDVLSEEYKKLWDSYFYPHTDVFMNKKGIMNNDELLQYERSMTDIKQQELHDNPIKGNFDINHLCDIHKYLFGDLYDWAGQYRKVYMKKRDGSYFTPVNEIGFSLQDNLKVMNEKLKDVYNKDTLAYFITDCYVAFLNTHPFRDGNGRTVREFLREFTVSKTGLLWSEACDLDWSLVNHKFVEELMPFGRAYYGTIKMEIMKAIVPYKKENSIKM